MPFVGLKYFAINTELLKAGFNATVFKPFITAKYVVDGEEEESNFKNSIFGSELGFVSEYFFSSNFSVGGEFGYRFGIGSSTYVGENSNIIYNDDKFRLNMTYVSASMNFYFD